MRKIVFDLWHLRLGRRGRAGRAFQGRAPRGERRTRRRAAAPLDECHPPADGWGRLEFREVRSASGRDWTDDGEVHETRAPKGGPRNAVRRVPIPPQLVQLLREHLEQHGTGPEGQLFLTYRGTTYQPSTLWRVLSEARVKAFTPAQVRSALALGRMTSVMPGCRGG